MKTRRYQIFALIGILLLLSAACSFSASTAKIKEAKMAREVNGAPQETTTFSPNDTFYCLVTVANAPDDTITKAVWSAVDVEGSDPNMVLQTTEFNGGGEITFHLGNDYFWPDGSYKVDIYLDDELKQTLEFNVTGNSGSAENSASVGEPAGVDGISVTNAYIARFVGQDPQQTDTYATNEDFYCVVELSSAQPDTKVTAVWSVVEAEGLDSNTVITKSDFSGESLMTFNLSYPEAWPVGKYKVEIYLNDQYEGYLDFNVQ